ncbi:uncharacterized protein BX664DRAFT_357228 [Halteromyces radiatus]|uniref:uncharacterized protein n=1 Tax=Halteromyces radiatus TaxID=101107 RepID=UPI00221E4451|nr:uncharacterized protein BX664DRAFT_357228 [Halteromyces radiatus]KAI8092712.1 hypothetical protein BX664DRAFT_357228 [Halteromyces radiatus]
MFWKKKDKDSSSTSTNPFEQSTPQLSSTPSYSSGSSAGYNSQPSYGGSRYSNNNDNDGGRYGQRTHEQDRDDLFGSPRRPQQQQYDSQGQEDAYGRSKSRYGEQDEDEEVGGIKKQIRDIKQESLQSTRNALQKIGEAEQSAAQSMNQLGTQSTQIANVSRNLDLAKAHSDRASSQADELKQLNRSIFIPVVKNPFNKGARQRREIEKLQNDHAEHMNEREDIRQFEYESSARIDQANRRNERGSSNGGYRRGRSEADRRRYQFEQDEEDDAVEDEIDQNLDLLGDATARLKNMAVTMNDELSSQNAKLGKLNTKVDPISQKLVATTHTLNKTR